MKIEPRQVGLKTILDLLKQKPGHLIFGIVFTLIPFLIGGIFLLILTFSGSDLPNVDYESVNKNGATTHAVVGDIEIQHNINVNGEHPRVITYSYKNGDKLVDDKFRVLDSVKASRLNIGDTIQIKHFQGQTIIDGLKPFGFPSEILSIVLIPFLILGLVALGLLYWRVKGQIDLFKNGKVFDAEIISMNHTSGMPISGIGQKITVHYQHQMTNGQKHLGESTTTDYTVLTSKKQGDTIKIFVSEADETKSCVIPRLDEIRNNWKIS